MDINNCRRGESDDDMLSPDSPMIDEGGSGEGNPTGGTMLKKGPWTSAEDGILVEYVKKHGEGNWNAVQKYSGLFRCGKSCRLRWANHLRPNLKKGAFTAEEERLIVELHAKMGNKWARMAAHLPGRTDNEIKNYWNTRIKRRQRAGLPLYPPELCEQAFQENQQNLNDDGLNIGENGLDPFQTYSYDIPDFMFGNISTTQPLLPYIPPLPDFSSASTLVKGYGSPQPYGFIPSVRPCQNRFLEPEQLSQYGGGMLSQYGRDQGDNCISKGSQPHNICFANPSPITKNLLPFGANQGRQPLSTGNASASMPTIGAIKLELPSFQYPDTTLDEWSTNPSLSPLESADSFIQSPPPPGPTQPYCASPRSSGLLESLVYESKALAGTKYPSSERSSNSSIATPEDITDCSPFKMSSAEHEVYNQSASIFSDCTPISATKCSQEEILPADGFSGSNLESEPMDYSWNFDESKKKESSTGFNYSRPDAILGSGWLGQSSTSCSKGQGIMTDTISALLGDDLSSNYRNTSETSTPVDSFGFDSSSWNISPLSNV